MTAIDLIAAERARQIAVEGWTPEHDDEHADDEMARAAACYALPWRVMEKRADADNIGLDSVPVLWPTGWATEFWKPTPQDRIRELVKAGALIVAEIERLQRAKPEEAPGRRG